MRTAIRFGLLVVFSYAAFAQTQPDAAEILKKVSETYKDVSQYEVESTVTIHDPSSGRDLSGSTRIAFKGPDKYREEAKGSLLTLIADPSKPVVDEAITVYDGSKMWVYVPKSNEYRVYAVPKLPRDSRPEDADLFMGIGPYRHAVEAFAPGHFLREERIASGGTADCFVIEATGPGAGALLWIDKNNYHVLRVDSAAEGYGSSQVFKTVKLNEPLSDDLFKFVPPPGATKLGEP
jgi:outer membrane lipoprotein-sorting protein